jgi:hypothetical protein
MGYREIDIPQAPFIGWGTKPGQIIEGVVTDYDPNGATTFAGEPCPALELELIRTGHSFTKGEWTTYEAGEVVLISCGQAKLKKGVRRAQPRIGNLIKIEMTGEQRVSNGTMKAFRVSVDSDYAKANGQVEQGRAPTQDPWANTPPPSEPPDMDDSPPF